MALLEMTLLNAGILFYTVAVILSFGALRSASPRMLARGRGAALLAAILHVALLARTGLESGHFPATNLFEFTLLLSTVVMLPALALDVAKRMPILSMGTAPLALVFSLTAALFWGAGPRPAQSVTTAWAAMHVLVTLVAFGSFALAFVSGLLYLFERRQLKGSPASRMLGFLPSLETLYRLTLGSVALGVALLTTGIVVGYLYARTILTGSSAWRTDPKVILSTATWLGYLLVIGASLLPSFRGRRTAMASVVCFALVIVTFWASVFWSPFHNFR